MEMRPLGVAKEIIEDIGSNISYTYEDLIFVEHNAFLIQFDDNNEKNFKLLINEDCNEEAEKLFYDHLVKSAADRECTIEKSGKYRLVQNENEETFNIEFL